MLVLVGLLETAAVVDLVDLMKVKDAGAVNHRTVAAEGMAAQELTLAAIVVNLARVMPLAATAAEEGAVAAATAVVAVLDKLEMEGMAEILDRVVTPVLLELLEVQEVQTQDKAEQLQILLLHQQLLLHHKQATQFL